jgi:L-ascorbate metabolism protein UlaG (beta-lactamase superfamily)
LARFRHWGLGPQTPGRFEHLASTPARGPADMLRWKVVDAVLGRNRKDPGGFATPARAYDRALVHGDAPSLTWIGHASFLICLGGVRALVDPIFSARLGPIRRLSPPGIPLEELPRVDLVLITHNHRDHLDAPSVRRLGPAPRYVCPLGNGAWLADAGAKDITELDWWQKTRIGDLEVTLVPSRHWSMRLPWDKNEALWGGYVLRSAQGTAYHSGDTAYFDGFTEIARREGPIDWALLPIGAYEPRWFMESQHVSPEEAVQAAVDLGARQMVAMHWGTFKLTDEPLAEPPERARAAWRRHGLDPERLWVLDIGETRALT